MKVLGFYKSKKYLQRVLISIMLSMFLVLLSLSIANTYILERSVKNNQQESNLKVLSQIQYNLSYMNEIITHLSNFVYKDNILIPMMFDARLPKMDLIRGYQRLNSILESSSFLHSMVVYNSASKEIYGTTTPFLLDDGVTKSAIKRWLLNPPSPHPTSKLIPTSLEKKNGMIDTFAFIVTTYLKPFNPNESAIILYVKSDWVFESLQKMNVSNDREQGELYIADQDGRLYASNHYDSFANEPDQQSIKQLLSGDKKMKNRQSGNVIGEISGKKNMITYMDDGIRNWTILYIQPYDKLMEEVRMGLK
ncbi:cache domain-containing protein [Paenibacillus solisilvae]|uniref:Cache domain-containing protein n=1 Tax=Paenibacillus solisilvae TaxID=2486751 RepID=A0ABW0W3Q2_9BACL